MTILTAKQQHFVKELIGGKTQTDAYRAAYAATNMNHNTVRREASRLMKNPNITTTEKDLQSQANQVALRENIATRQQVLQTLTRCMRETRTGDSTRVRAAELLGKHYGLFNQEEQKEAPPRSAEQIKSELNRLLLRHFPEQEGSHEKNKKP